MRSLGLSGYSIAEALVRVPNLPGLYALHARPEVWVLLDFEDRGRGVPLYVGKAEESLVSRDLKTHFSSGKTGSSTLRRSFAALLRELLDLHAIPRNPAKPGHYSMFALASAGDQALTDWMREHLTLAVWPKPADENCVLDDVETAVLDQWQPPMNLAKVRYPSPRLKAARKQMADEARAFAAAHS
jgi:hypothetical protein